jgi:hypothetical protein
LSIVFDLLDTPTLRDTGTLLSCQEVVARAIHDHLSFHLRILMSLKKKRKKLVLGSTRIIGKVSKAREREREGFQGIRSGS